MCETILGPRKSVMDPPNSSGDADQVGEIDSPYFGLGEMLMYVAEVDEQPRTNQAAGPARLKPKAQ